MSIEARQQGITHNTNINAIRGLLYAFLLPIC